MTLYTCECGAVVIKTGNTDFKFEDRYDKLRCTVENEQLKFWCINCKGVINFPFPILAREGLIKVGTFMSEYEEDPGRYAPQAVVDVVRQIIEYFTPPSKGAKSKKFKELPSSKYEVLQEGSNFEYDVLAEPGEEESINYHSVWVGFSSGVNNVTRLIVSKTKPETDHCEFFKGPFNVQILTKPDEKPVNPTGKTYKYKKKEKSNHSLQELKDTHVGAAWECTR